MYEIPPGEWLIVAEELRWLENGEPYIYRIGPFPRIGDIINVAHTKIRYSVEEESQNGHKVYLRWIGDE